MLSYSEELVTDDVRKRCTIQICAVLSSVYFKQLRYLLFIRSYAEIQAPSIIQDVPSALAATNQIALFLEWFQDNPDILWGGSILPTPLVSASACGHVKILQEIMQLEGDQVNKTTNQTPTQENEKHRRKTPRYREALAAAMKKGQRETGQILLDHFLRRVSARDPRSPRSRVLLMEAVKHVDAGFICEIRYKKTVQEETLRPNEIRQVLLKGTCSVLRFLLENEYMDPNTLECTTPLTLAVHNHRYDLARILLQCGADINGVPQQGPPITALCCAATTGYRGYGDRLLPGVRFLLENGADPVIRYWKNPRQTLWSDVEFLLQQAAEHGNEVALRHETWSKYQDAKSEQTETILME